MRDFDLLRHKVNKSAEASNEYYLTVTVPREITHSFETKIILLHPTTGQKKAVPIKFDHMKGDPPQPRPAPS